MEDGHCWVAGAVLAALAVVVVVVAMCHVVTMIARASATDFNSEVWERRLALLEADENAMEVQEWIGRGWDWPRVGSVADERSAPLAHRTALFCAVLPEIPNDQDGQGKGHKRHVITLNDEGETPKTVHVFQQTAWLGVDLSSRGGSCGPMDKPAPSIQIPVRAARVTTVNDEGETPKVVHVFERAWIEPTREEGRLSFAQSEASLQAPVHGPSFPQEKLQPGHCAIEAPIAEHPCTLTRRYRRAVEQR